MLFLKEYWSDQNFTRIILHDEGLEEFSVDIVKLHHNTFFLRLASHDTLLAT